MKKLMLVLGCFLFGVVAEARKNCTQVEAIRCKCPNKYSCYVFSDGPGCNTPGEPGTGFYLPCGRIVLDDKVTNILGRVDPETRVPEACSKK